MKVEVQSEVHLEDVLNSVSVHQIKLVLGAELLDAFDNGELLEFVGKEKAKQFFNLTEE